MFNLRLPFARPAAPIFQALAEEWLRLQRAKHHRPGWHAAVSRILRRDIIPYIGCVFVDRITRQDIARLVARIEERGHTSKANHTLVVCRDVFRWSIDTGRVDIQNPGAGLRKRPVASRERTLSEPELVTVWHALSGMRTTSASSNSSCSPAAARRRLVRWYGQRSNMTAPGGPQIELPGTRTKNKRPHVIPLTKFMLSLLPERRPGTPYLFGSGPAGFRGWPTGKRELDRKISGMAPWTVHDLRRTFSTLMAERELAPPHVVEACINHIGTAKLGVAGVYNRATYAKAKREALERWCAHVAALVGVAQIPLPCPSAAA